MHRPQVIVIMIHYVCVRVKVLVDLTLQHLEEWLAENNIPKIEIVEHLKLTRLFMNQNIFQFNNRFYKQTAGTSVGNPLNPFHANLFIRI